MAFRFREKLKLIVCCYSFRNCFYCEIRWYNKHWQNFDWENIKRRLRESITIENLDFSAILKEIIRLFYLNIICKNKLFLWVSYYIRRAEKEIEGTKVDCLLLVSLKRRININTIWMRHILKIVGRLFLKKLWKSKQFDFFKW